MPYTDASHLRIVRDNAEAPPATEQYRYYATKSQAREYLTEAFGDEILEDARERLWRRRREFSARKRLTWPQSAAACLAAVALAWGFAIEPAATTVAVNLVLISVFIPVIGFRLLALAHFLSRGPRHRPARRESAESGALRRLMRIDEADLPPYTILAPLYKEREMLGQLISALDALDYPHDRLDIKIIVEADDVETLGALASFDLDARYHIVKTPPSSPRTKPKALNYALAFAEGDFVTIYDAEDVPAPDQLKTVAAYFARCASNIVCVQARLGVYNARERWLTRQFAMEYAVHFNLFLPALERIGWPIPLGGTSNHFRVSALEALDAWDPYNVTEDADLGVRLSVFGYKSGVVDSETAEEAPESLAIWTRQRARWIKGFIQTLIVFSRQPVARLEKPGLWRMAGVFVFLGGAVMTAFVYPLIVAAWFVGVFFEIPELNPFTGGRLAAINLAVFSGGLTASAGACVAVAWRSGLSALGARNWRQLAAMLATLPLYRFWTALAGMLALWDLLRRPSHWRKTPHKPRAR
ncbi:MAG: glycosyltransferase family 2 protein [Parvularculaceae bacterium]